MVLVHRLGQLALSRGTRRDTRGPHLRRSPDRRAEQPEILGRFRGVTPARLDDLPRCCVRSRPDRPWGTVDCGGWRRRRPVIQGHHHEGRWPRSYGRGRPGSGGSCLKSRRSVIQAGGLPVRPPRMGSGLGATPDSGTEKRSCLEVAHSQSTVPKSTSQPSLDRLGGSQGVPVINHERLFGRGSKLCGGKTFGHSGNLLNRSRRGGVLNRRAISLFGRSHQASTSWGLQATRGDPRRRDGWKDQQISGRIVSPIAMMRRKRI